MRFNVGRFIFLIVSVQKPAHAVASDMNHIFYAHACRIDEVARLSTEVTRRAVYRDCNTQHHDRQLTRPHYQTRPSIPRSYSSRLH